MKTGCSDHLLDQQSHQTVSFSTDLLTMFWSVNRHVFHPCVFPAKLVVFLASRSDGKATDFRLFPWRVQTHTWNTKKKWPGCDKCEFDTTLLPLLHNKRRRTGWRLMKQRASEPLLELKSGLRSVRGYFLNVSEWGTLKTFHTCDRLWKQRNADIMLWAVALQLQFLLIMCDESDHPAAHFTLTVWRLQTSWWLCLRVCVFGKW